MSAPRKPQSLSTLTRQQLLNVLHGLRVAIDESLADLSEAVNRKNNFAALSAFDDANRHYMKLHRVHCELIRRWKQYAPAPPDRVPTKDAALIYQRGYHAGAYTEKSESDNPFDSPDRKDKWLTGYRAGRRRRRRESKQARESA